MVQTTKKDYCHDTESHETKHPSLKKPKERENHSLALAVVGRDPLWTNRLSEKCKSTHKPQER